MKSMTGFGLAQSESESCRVTVSIRTVNHRFLDLALRLPDELRELEPKLRNLVRERLARGRVDLRLDLERLGDDRAAVSVDEELARELAGALGELVQGGTLEGRLTVGDVLRLPDVVRLRHQPARWSASDEALLLAVVTEALDIAVEARRREGLEIAEILGRRLDELDDLVGRLAAKRETVREELLTRLRNRLAELASEIEIPEERIAAEVAVLVERSDVQEELDRLTAHLKQFREAIAADDPVGRRLDFLSQEILRELNTVASKSRDGAMAAWVIEAKVACEQLREQVQNVE